MMKTNNYTNKTPEQLDDFIQSLSIDDLKLSFIGSSIYTELNDDLKLVDEFSETDENIQDLQLSDLRNFVNFVKFPEQDLTIQYKISHTGLDENTILLIETNKYRATLEQIISYCRGLKINYKEFLPELF